MADYPDYSERTGGKGLFVAILLLGAFVVGLIYLGATSSTTSDAVQDSPAAPTANGEVAPASD